METTPKQTILQTIVGILNLFRPSTWRAIGSVLMCRNPDTKEQKAAIRKAHERQARIDRKAAEAARSERRDAKKGKRGWL